MGIDVQDEIYVFFISIFTVRRLIYSCFTYTWIVRRRIMSPRTQDINALVKYRDALMSFIRRIIFIDFRAVNTER